MASFRRTQSPAYHDRSYLINSFSLPSTTSPSPKHFSSSQSHISRFLSSISLQKPSRKPNQPWKWSIYKFLICFSLGFVLGLSPFFHNLSNNDTNESAAAAAAIIIKPHQTNVEKIVFETVSLGLIQDSPPPPLEPLPQPNKQLIVITPTYNRALQAYYLNRLAQALLLVPPPVLWIVVEMNSAEMETAEILRRSGVMYRHLVCGKNSTNVKDRGVHQRNTALEHIERHRLDGIVYFADDDNVYEVDLFQSLRYISRFGTWPVAMLAQSKAKTILEGPICNGSQVIGWHTNEKSKRLRRFHVDMSGFAFNSTILWDPKRWNRTTSNPIRQLDTVKEGFQETTFIEQVIEDEFQMEGVPYGCSRVMNWHLHLDAHNLVYPRGWLLQKNLDVVLPLE